MADFTAKLGLRKPDGDPVSGDNVNVDTDLNANFDKIDDAVGFKAATSGSRPEGVDRWDGRPIIETDTKKAYVWFETDGQWREFLLADASSFNFGGPINLSNDDHQVNIGGSGSGANFAAMNDGTRALLSGRLNGDVNNRYQIAPDGQVSWGDGTAALDTNLYRSAANTLKTDDSLIVASGLTVGADPVKGRAIAVNDDETPRNNTTTQAVDTNMQINITTTGWWIWEALVIVKSNSTADFKLSFAVGNMSNSNLRYSIFYPQGGTNSGLLFGGNTFVMSIPDTNFYHLLVRGSLNANNIGTLALWWAQNTSDAGPTNLVRGSWIKAEKV